MENVNVNVNNGNETESSSHVRAFKHFTGIISKAKWKSIMKVYFVLFFFLATGVALVFTYTAAKDNELVSQTTKKILKERKEENLRDFVVTPKIQHELAKLVYVLNANRAFLFELHNGKKNTSGLPFRFADMSYEEVNEERTTDKVAISFQNIPLTLYKYPHYLQKQKLLIGNLKDIGEVDPDFAGHIRDVGGVYLGMIYINSNGLPLGFLCVSYHSMTDVPADSVIEAKLREYAKPIGQLLDLQVQMYNNNEEE